MSFMTPWSFACPAAVNIYYLYYISQARMGAGIASGILKDGVKEEHVDSNRF
jgi:hypothetical protein